MHQSIGEFTAFLPGWLPSIGPCNGHLRAVKDPTDGVDVSRVRPIAEVGEVRSWSPTGCAAHT